MNRRIQPRRAKNAGKTLKRLLAYLFKYHKIEFAFVLFSILVSSLANILGTYFISILIDDFIEPNIGKAHVNFTPMIIGFAIMAGIFLIGYRRLRHQPPDDQRLPGRHAGLRNEVFEHMQKLPIRFFDTHTHGELMSRFTNDIDTLRQMLSQSLPQLFTSSVTIIGIFISMLLLSPLLTLSVIVMILVLTVSVRKLGAKSAKNFIKRQQAIGKMNGYIEEMIEGQKVVKVFCYEEKSKARFDEINEYLRDASTKADTYANIIMPITGNVGYFTYALTAALGGIVSIFQLSSLTLGQLGAFLEFSRRFARPITWISQQVNAILMALAGAERIFALLDQEPDPDEGVVTLTNAEFNEAGELLETEGKTGVWAWKEPLADGSYRLTQVKGNVVFENVSFGYDPEKKSCIMSASMPAPDKKLPWWAPPEPGKPPSPIS